MAIELATAEPAEPENLRGVDATLAIRLGDVHAIAQESARNRVFAKMVDCGQSLL